MMLSINSIHGFKIATNSPPQVFFPYHSSYHVFQSTLPMYDYNEKNVVSIDNGGNSKTVAIHPTKTEPLFLMDYLCGDGRSSQELLEQYPSSVVVGIVDEHLPKNKNILRHRFPEVWFETMDSVKQDPVLFDLIQIHHERINNKIVFMKDTVPFLLQHLSIHGEIHYHFNDIKDFMEIPFLDGKIVRDFQVGYCKKKKTIKFIKCV